MSAAFAVDLVSLEVELGALERAGTAHREAVRDCDRWALDKPAEKVAAIRRIMATENPLTNKQHSATSAETVAETDDAYRTFLARASDRTVRRMELETRYLVARLRSEAAARGLGQ